MTPREITEARNAALDIGKMAEQFAADSTPYFIIREAERRLYDVAWHFEQRNIRTHA